MNDQKNKWIWVGVAVVVVAVVVAVVIWFMGGEQGPNLGPIPVHAPTGQVIEGFPKGLILGTAPSSGTVTDFFAGITNSYSINYSSSTNQYTAEWISSSTLAALYAQYRAYLADNGWTITNHADTAVIKFIYATNASSSIVNIVITPQEKGAPSKGSKVIASYVSTAQAQ